MLRGRQETWALASGRSGLALLQAQRLAQLRAQQRAEHVVGCSEGDVGTDSDEGEQARQARQATEQQLQQASTEQQEEALAARYRDVARSNVLLQQLCPTTLLLGHRRARQGSTEQHAVDNTTPEPPATSEVELPWSRYAAIAHEHHQRDEAQHQPAAAAAGSYGRAEGQHGGGSGCSSPEYAAAVSDSDADEFGSAQGGEADGLEADGQLWGVDSGVDLESDLDDLPVQWRALEFQPPETLLEELLPAVGDELQALHAVACAMRAALPHMRAQEEDDCHSALRAMQNWVSYRCAPQLHMLLDQSGRCLEATMQCSEVIGALEEIAIKEEQRVVVMAGSLDRLEEYCRRLHEPGTMVADLARLVRRVDASLLDDEAWRWLLDHGKSSQDGLTVARYAVEGLLILHEAAGYNTEEWVSGMAEPLDAAALAMLRNMAQTLRGRGPGTALPVAFLYRALEVPPCGLAWARDLLLARDNVLLYGSDEAHGSAPNARAVYQELQRQYSASAAGGAAAGAAAAAGEPGAATPPARFSPGHLCLVALLASDDCVYLLARMIELITFWYGFTAAGSDGAYNLFMESMEKLRAAVELLGADAPGRRPPGSQVGKEEEEASEEDDEEDEVLFGVAEPAAGGRLREAAGAEGVGQGQGRAAARVDVEAEEGPGLEGLPAFQCFREGLKEMVQRVDAAACCGCGQLVGQRAMELLFTAAESPAGAALLGTQAAQGGGGQGSGQGTGAEVAEEVRREVEAASEQVAELLLPVVPVGVLLEDDWREALAVQAQQYEQRAKWLAAAGGAVKQLFDRAWFRQLRPGEAVAAVAALQPGLLQNAACGAAWRAAVEAVEAEPGARGVAWKLLRCAVTGLCLCVSMDLPQERVHLLPCALAGLMLSTVLEELGDKVKKPEAVYVSYNCLLYLTHVPYTVAGAARPSSPVEVTVGLVQHLYRFLSDELLCTAETVCVRQALEHRRPDREVIIGPPPKRGKDGAAGRAPCGALETAVLHAAKLLATRDLRPKHQGNYTQVAGAGKAGQREQTEAPAGQLPQGQRLSLGPGTQLLWAGLSAEQVVWTLVQVWLGPASGKPPPPPPPQQQQQQQQQPGGQGRQEGVLRLLMAGDPSLLTLLLLLLSTKSTIAAGSGWPVVQPAVDAHLANMLLPCDTPVTEEACYNPPPAAPALVVLDLHGNGALGSYTEAAKAVMNQYMLSRVTGDPKTPRYADALKRLREALVDKPRVNATWVAPQGVRGVQRALLLLAKVRQELLSKGRDLSCFVCEEITEHRTLLEAAETEQLQSRRSKQLGRQGPGPGPEGGAEGGRGAKGVKQGARQLDWGTCPLLTRETYQVLHLLVRDLGSLRGYVEQGVLKLQQGGGFTATNDGAKWDLTRVTGYVSVLLRLLRDPGCVVRDHVRVELLLQEVELGRVDRLVPGREEAKAAEATGAVVARAKGTGGGEVKAEDKGAKEVAGAAGKKQNKKDLAKLMFGK